VHNVLEHADQEGDDRGRYQNLQDSIFEAVHNQFKEGLGGTGLSFICAVLLNSGLDILRVTLNASFDIRVETVSDTVNTTITCVQLIK